MSTTYTGDPTVALSPDTLPVPGHAPQVTIPAAGELQTISASFQAVKALANNVAWHFKPRAKSATTDVEWAGEIMAWRTAALHRRSIIDHIGFRAGQVIEWEQDWSRAISVSGTSGTGGYLAGASAVDLEGCPLSLGAGNFGSLLEIAANNVINAAAASTWAAAQSPLDTAGHAILDALVYLQAVQGQSGWKVRTLQTGGSSFAQFFPPDGGTVNPRHRYGVLGAGSVVSDYALINRIPQGNFDNALHHSMSWHSQLEAVNMGAKLAWSAGWCNEGLLPEVAGGSATDYFVFAQVNGQTNWFVFWKSAGGAQGSQDTGVAVDTNWHRFRVEAHGSGVADNATRAFRALIDGAVVATVTGASCPVTTAKATPSFGLNNLSGGAHGLTLPVRLGPVQGRQNILGSDASV